MAANRVTIRLGGHLIYVESKHRVVVVHDYVTQRGGAERVALELLRAFPDSRLVTSAWNPATTFEEFADFPIETLWLNKVPAFRRDPRLAFPFLASAFARHVIDDADLVISSSSGWSHRVQTHAPKMVYCYNPARWLYQPDDYFATGPGWVRNRFAGASGGLRRSDAEAAQSAAAYVTTSTAVADRIESTYGFTPAIIPPPRGLTPEGPIDPIAGLWPGFLLTVSRTRGYKHTDRIVAAVKSMPGQRLVVVGGGPDEWESDAVTVLRTVSDAGLRWLYSNASALVAASHEDFGLTPVEAQAFGTPSVALRAGGYLDTTVDGQTGVFFDEPTAGHIVGAITQLHDLKWDDDLIRKWGERFAPATFSARIRSAADDVLAGRSIRLAS